MRFVKKSTYKSTIVIPGDKSISHRALLFNSLAKGMARIENLLMGEDVRSTMDCLRKLGVKIHFEDGVCILTGSDGEFTQPECRKVCEVMLQKASE